MEFVKINNQFEIGKYLVTIGEWVEYCTAANKPIRREIIEKYCQKSNHPVTHVSWYEAKEFCDYYGYELPTEEQWYLAAAGKEKRTYPWGNDFNSAYCNTCESGINDTTPVTFYPNGATPEGVFDMAGNVWEWTASKHENGGFVVRGGSWVGESRCARSAYRLGHPPVARVGGLGFRCARKVKTEQKTINTFIPIRNTNVAPGTVIKENLTNRTFTVLDYRKPKQNEYYLDLDGMAYKHCCGYEVPARPILELVKD